MLQKLEEMLQPTGNNRNLITFLMLPFSRTQLPSLLGALRSAALLSPLPAAAAERNPVPRPQRRGPRKALRGHAVADVQGLHQKRLRGPPRVRPLSIWLRIFL